MNPGILADIFGPDLLVVALIAVVVLFGGSQLPKLARSLGSASHEFRKGMEEGAKEGAGDSQATDAAPKGGSGPAASPDSGDSSAS